MPSQPSTFNSQLLQHFDTLAETPDAVAKLRDLVLNLAVRGNLVPQIEKDESGAELLIRILEEKRRLTREGVIKKTLVLDSISPDACPFEAPKNWAWAYLNDFGDWGSGSTPNRSNHEFYDGTIPWLKSGELNDGIVSESEEKVTELALEKCSLRLNKPGDVLLAMYGATVGKVAILGVEATTNQAVCACTCFSGVFNRYLFVLLKAFKQQFISESAGAAQPNFSKEKIIRTVAPLPPLAEQRRIVAKVEELLALCDELEEAQTAAREHRTRLVRSALDHLTTAQTEPEFRQHSSFVLQHSDLVLDSVSDLRHAILSLAVQGRLASQDSSDEGAAVLFEKIKKTKQKLFQEGRLRKIEVSSSVGGGESLWKLPDSWLWARLTDLYDVRDGTHDTPKYVAQGFPLVTSKNLYTGKLDMADVKFISAADHAQICERSKVEQEDILFAMIGSIGNPVIVDVKPDFSIKNVALFKYYSRNLSEPRFLHLYLRFAAQRMREVAAGGVQSFVSLGFLRQYPFPLPPLAEQQRIVAKVDELMRWCDELEARLAAAQTTATSLLDATLHQMLASNSSPP